MPRRLLSAAAVGALLLGLAACGDETDGPATTPPPSIDVAGPSDGGGDTEPSDGGGDETAEPTADAPDIPPPDPADFAGMDEHTPEGAEQAFRYYIAVLMWSRQTGEVSTLEALTSPNCQKCSDLSAKINQARESGELWEGINIVDTGTENFESTNYDIEVGYVYTSGEHTDPSSADPMPATEWTAIAGMNWSSGNWIIQELEMGQVGNDF